MIVIRVELWSAITGKKTEIARAHICNVGIGGTLRNYRGVSFVGRSAAQLDKQVVSHTGEVQQYPAERLHVWNLVARMLASMGYTK